MFDASTLGKIEVVGPDAAEFLNRMYTNAWEKLEPGRCRYGIMLREDGFIYDDGVVGRSRRPLPRHHDDRRRAARAEHDGGLPPDRVPDLKVWLTSTTEQWAVIAVQGPKARDVIAPLVEGIDIAREAMPHMSCARAASAACRRGSSA
jgi:sarcosine oxidase, subunit alpha